MELTEFIDGVQWEQENPTVSVEMKAVFDLGDKIHHSKYRKNEK